MLLLLPASPAPPRRSLRLTLRLIQRRWLWLCLAVFHAVRAALRRLPGLLLRRRAHSRRHLHVCGLEVFRLQALRRCRALLRVPAHHCCHQLTCIGAGIRYQRLEGRLHELRKAKIHLTQIRLLHLFFKIPTDFMSDTTVWALNLWLLYNPSVERTICW